MKKIIYLLIAIWGICGSVAAQQYMSVPYSFDFELADSVEIQNWVFNPGADATFPEHWVVGSSEHSSGRCALYISADSVSAGYTVARTVQYAYRDVMLPAGKYIFSFDWKCVGSAKSTLSAGYALASQLTAMQAQKTSATIPTAIVNKVNVQMKNRNGERTWQSASFQIQSNGTDPTRVFFAWSNSETDSSNCTLGACVDNIQITSTACPRPDNVSVEVVSCDEVLIHWTGASAGYEVQYRLVGADVWDTCYNVTISGNNGTGMCTNMNEGSYDFRVRGICTPDTSAWANCSNYFVYCEDQHCINFADLNGPNVTCYSGTTRDSYATSKSAAYSTVGVIDFGSDDIRSRHTVNTDPTAIDPRTGGNLPLIPSGSRASVRLGNWNSGSEAEAVSYRITVDNASAEVSLQYAVVKDDPGHGGDADPRFVIEISNQYGSVVEPVCGENDVLHQDDWITISTSNYSFISYKPWTKQTLNLHAMGFQNGDEVVIRLTNYDCFYSGHYGYAYFTLDCAKETNGTDPTPDEPQNVVEIHHDSMATKVLLDGRVYIDRYGVLYDMMGHPVY